MWGHMYGRENHHCCKYYIYVLSYIALEYFIIIDTGVFAPVHGRDAIDGLNSRYKFMPKLAISKPFNLELICD